MPTFVSDFTALLSGSSWNADYGTHTVVTYSFPDEPAPRHTSDAFMGDTVSSAWVTFSAQDRALTRAALNRWSEVSGLTFVEVQGTEADMTFGRIAISDLDGYDGVLGFAYYPDSYTNRWGSVNEKIGGDVFIETAFLGTADLSYILLHEIGHAIGLQHPFDSDVQLLPEFDTARYTQMSYDLKYNNPHLGLFDIEAVQHIYGMPEFAASTTGGLEVFDLNLSGPRYSLRTVWGDADSAIHGSGLNDDITDGAGNDTVAGFAGRDILRDGLGNDVLVGNDGRDTIIAGPGDDIYAGGDDLWNYYYHVAPGNVDTVDYSAVTTNLFLQHVWDPLGFLYYGVQGSETGKDQVVAIETIVTGSGDDVIYDRVPQQTEFYGLPQNIQLRTGLGSDYIEAGYGDDTVLAGGGGQDTLIGGDGWDTLIAEGDGLYHTPESAQVFRLYLSVFGRAPDTGGHRVWTELLIEKYASLQQVANLFVTSPEFLDTFGDDTSNTQFISLMYRNVLDRTPLAWELATWVDNLNRGVTRAEAVVAFSESLEHRILSHDAKDAFDDRHDTTFWADDVFRLYQAIFDRVPDTAGFEGWVENIASGDYDYAEVVGMFTQSAEFAATYGATTDTGFVTLLYDNVLDRAPDAGGLAGWTANMASGMSRDDVVAHFANSAEFVAATAAGLYAYMMAAGPDDYIDSGIGGGRLSGGLYSDTFVLGDDAIVSTVTITDLEAWDRFDFSRFTLLVDDPRVTPSDDPLTVTDILGAMHQDGTDVVFQTVKIELQGTDYVEVPIETVIFEDTTLAQISAGMILV